MGHIYPIKGAVLDITSPASPPIGGILEADVQVHIGRKLRAVYDEVVAEAVPDRLARLLAILEQQRANHS